jgi:hypothetical protein
MPEEPYDDFRLEPPRVVDIGHGVVLAIANQGGRPRGSSAELSQELALIYEWSNGLVVRVIASAAHDDVDKARCTAERTEHREDLLRVAPRIVAPASAPTRVVKTVDANLWPASFDPPR